MPARDRQKWFLKEWRKYRGLSQEKLAERLGWYKGDISNLEKGKRRYNQDVLEQLADALELPRPGYLVMVDPTDPNGIWSLWEEASEGERLDIIRLAKVVRRENHG